MTYLNYDASMYALFSIHENALCGLPLFRFNAPTFDSPAGGKSPLMFGHTNRLPEDLGEIEPSR